MFDNGIVEVIDIVPEVFVVLRQKGDRLDVVGDERDITQPDHGGDGSTQSARGDASGKCLRGVEVEDDENEFLSLVGAFGARGGILPGKVLAENTVDFGDATQVGQLRRAKVGFRPQKFFFLSEYGFDLLDQGEFFYHGECRLVVIVGKFWIRTVSINVCKKTDESGCRDR